MKFKKSILLGIISTVATPLSFTISCGSDTISEKNVNFDQLLAYTGVLKTDDVKKAITDTLNGNVHYFTYKGQKYDWTKYLNATDDSPIKVALAGLVEELNQYYPNALSKPLVGFQDTGKIDVSKLQMKLPYLGASFSDKDFLKAPLHTHWEWYSEELYPVLDSGGQPIEVWYPLNGWQLPYSWTKPTVSFKVRLMPDLGFEINNHQILNVLFTTAGKKIEMRQNPDGSMQQVILDDPIVGKSHSDLIATIKSYIAINGDMAGYVYGQYLGSILNSLIKAADTSYVDNDQVISTWGGLKTSDLNIKLEVDKWIQTHSSEISKISSTHALKDLLSTSLKAQGWYNSHSTIDQGISAVANSVEKFINVSSLEESDVLNSMLQDLLPKFSKALDDAKITPHSPISTEMYYRSGEYNISFRLDNDKMNFDVVIPNVNDVKAGFRTQDWDAIKSDIEKIRDLEAPFGQKFVDIDVRLAEIFGAKPQSLNADIHVSYNPEWASPFGKFTLLNSIDIRDARFNLGEQSDPIIDDEIIDILWKRFIDSENHHFDSFIAYPFYWSIQNWEPYDVTVKLKDYTATFEVNSKTAGNIFNNKEAFATFIRGLTFKKAGAPAHVAQQAPPHVGPTAT